MNKKVNINNANLVFEELEPRLLLSADGLGVFTESSVATLQTLVHGENENIIIVQNQTEQSSTTIHNKAQSDSRSELVIIDSRAPNFQQLHNDVIKAQQQGRDINVVILDAHRDGIEQISEALSKYNKLDAVHIISHGKDAQLQLGATQLNNQNLKQHNEEINKWKQVFTEGGDLLIYGCNLAGTSNGTDLVNSLSGITGADVAASDDVTGNAILGGDWDLEYQTGDIETNIAFTDDIQDNWQGTLNADALAAQQAALAEEQQYEETQVQAEQEAALVAESEAVLLAEEKEAEADTNINSQEAQQQASIVEEQRLEIVFIDESVEDYQAFIDDLNNNSDGSINFEVVLLDNDRNGIEQISETLASYNDVDAVHIFSHGDDGTVKLGNTWLSAENIGDYSDSINAWGSSLDESADILIYGCNLAESEAGVQFVNQLASLTSADVAASDDLTGSAALGGDWDLEYQQGNIETDVAVSADIQNNWDGILGSANLTETWSGSGPYSSTTTDTVPVIVTMDFSTPAGTAVQNTSAQSLTTNAFFSDTYVEGANAFYAELVWDTTPEAELTPAADDAGTIIVTVTFDTAVVNPIIHIDKLGYFGGTTSNSSEWTVTTAGATLTKLAGVDHLNVTSNTFYRTPNVATSTNEEASADSSTGTAAGSIQVNGTFTTLTFEVTGIGVEGLGVDGVEIAWEVAAFVNDVPVITSSAAVNVVENQTAVTTVTATDADGDTQTFSITGGTDASLFSIDASTGGLTFNSAHDFDTPTDANTDNVYEVTVQTDDGNGGTDSQAISVTVTPQEVLSLWLSTDGDVASPSGAPGLDAWSDAEALQFGGPSLTLEPGTTAGSFSSVFNLDNFTVGKDTTGMHFVTSNITVGGANSIDLRAGDLLFSIGGNTTLTSSNILEVESKDVILFRPDTLGNYSTGTFTLLLDDPFASNVKGISLVEADTNVGGITVSAGSFLLTKGDKNIYHYSADDVGFGTTSGTQTTLIDGGDINFSDNVDGIELIESTVSAGGKILQPGQILVTLEKNDTSVGDNLISVNEQDIFILNVTQAGATTIADATLLFEGIDVGLDTGQEDLDAIALEVNLAPVATDDTYNAIMNTPLVVSAADGILNNDGHPNADSYTWVLDNDVNYGTLLLNADGSFTYTPLVNFTGEVSFSYHLNDGELDSAPATVTLKVQSEVSAISLLITTDSDVTSNGATGFDSWTNGEILELSDPGLVLEPGTTAGTFSSLINLDDFAAGGNVTINAIDYVSNNITIGSDTTIDLLSGDLLLVANGNEDLSSNNLLTVAKDDVFIFRPNVAGDYTLATGGTFIMLLDNMVGAEVRAISLVEQDTIVGDSLVTAGSFLFATSGGGIHDQIRIFTPTSVGENTTVGSEEVLITGADIGYAGEQIHGVELIEQNTTVGGASLQSGTILLTSTTEIVVGNNSLPVTRHDIFALDISKTTLVSGTTVADASLLFEGADIGLDANGEDIKGIALIAPPTAILDLDADNSSTATGANYIGTFTTGGGAVNITDTDASLSHSNISTLASMTITLTNALDGAPEVLTADTTGTSITSLYDGNVLTLSGVDTLAKYQQVLRTVTYENMAVAPDISDRVITFIASDGSELSNSGMALISIAAPDAPVKINNTGSTVLEGGTDTLLNSELLYDDAQPATEVTFTLTTNPVNGQLELTTAAGVAITSFTQDDIDNNRLVYVHNDSQTTSDSFVFSVDDGLGNVLSSQNFLITVTPQNDAATATNLSAPETYSEDTPLNLSNIFVTDVDSATVTVTLTLSDIAAGSLSTGISGAVTSTYDAGTGIWQASGAIANVNTLLASVTFTPTLNYNSNFSITTSVDDGEALAITGIKVMTGTAVSDAPVNSVPAAQTIDEDNPLIFNTVNGNLISISDVDAGAGLMEVTLSVNDGILSLSGTFGLTFVAGSDGSSTMTFSGTLSDINTALDGLSYTPTTDFNGSDTLTLSTLDSDLVSLNIDANLTGYYSFDNTGDLGNDGSVAGTNDGTIVGATTVADGSHGDVLGFDGNDYVQISGLYGNPADVTLAAWVNLTTTSPNGPQVISLGDSVLLQVDNSEGGAFGVTGVWYDGTDWNNIASGTFIEGTGWHHIAYSFDDTNNTQTIYIDGVAINTEVVTTSISYSLGTDTFIGTHATGQVGYDFTGQIDDARIYDRVLTADEVATLANDLNLQDTDTVAITVNAVNDAPVITSDGGADTASLDVLENDLNVSTILASDIDIPAATLTYSISGGIDATLFSIDQDSGVLVFNTAPDFEIPGDSNSDNIYQVEVQVSDGIAIDTQVLTITVINQNDNDPIITSNGGGDTAAISTVENVTGEVVNVDATDADGNSIFYAIVGGADEIRFTIDAATGLLSFATPPNYEVPVDADGNNLYEVLVQASDGTRTDTQTISITVTDINDAPVLDNSGDMFLTTILENHINNDGDLIADIIASAGGDRITDDDAGATEGIAVMAVDDSFGTWQYSTDNGSSWIDFGAVSDLNAVILSPSDYIRFTPEVNASGTSAFSFRAWDTTDGNPSGTAAINVSVNGNATAYSSTIETARVEIIALDVRMLVTTTRDVSNADTSNLQNWTTGTIVGIADPGLQFEDGNPETLSSGTFTALVNFDDFAADLSVNISSLHYVSAPVTVGSGDKSVDLLKGDILFVTEDNETLTSPNSNSLSFNSGDIIAYRPDNFGNYSDGTFIHLLDNPTSDNLTGISLVEADITVGDALLTAGTLLYTYDGTQGNNIYHYTADNTGAGTTTGDVSTLIDGTDINMGVGASNKLVGMTLVTEDMSLNGAFVPAGSIITSINNVDNDLGDNSISVTPDDFFYLTVYTTGEGTTTADATILYEADDAGLKDKFSSLTFIVDTPGSNLDPKIINSDPFMVYRENDPATIVDTSFTVTDGDSANFDGGFLSISLGATGTLNDYLSIENQGIAAGQVGIWGNGVTYSGSVIGTFSGGTNGVPLTISFTSKAAPVSVQALLRAITYENLSDNPDTTTRTVSFTMTDGVGGTSNTATATINLLSVNDAPAGTDTTVTTTEDTAYVFATIDFGFTDIDANNLLAVTISSLPGTGTLYNNGTAVTAGQLISVADINAGLLVYAPLADANGSAVASFTFRVKDDGGLANGGDDDDDSANLIIIDITPVQDAFDDSISTNEDTAATINVFDNDSFDAGATLISVTQGANGSVSSLADGSVTYTPNANYHGSDSFTYTVTSGGVTETATVNVTVTPVVDLTATDDSFTTSEDTALVASVATNDSTTSGGTLSYAVATDVTHGALVFNNDGTFTYTPTANYNGADAFTYTVTDADSGEASTQTVALTITAVNDNPTTSGLSDLTVAEDAADSVVDLFAAFADIEDTDATLTYTLVSNSNAGLFAATTIDAAAGTLTLDYAANQNGAADLTVRATDTGGLWIETTFSVTVTAVVDLTATDDSFTTSEDTALVANVATNDTTTSGGTLSYAVAIDVTHGALVFNNDGTFTYTPTANYSGADAFTYTVTDADSGEASTQTVALTITAVNDNPTTSGLSDLTVAEDAADSVVDLFAAFADIEDTDATLTYTLVSNSNAAYLRRRPSMRRREP